MFQSNRSRWISGIAAVGILTAVLAPAALAKVNDLRGMAVGGPGAAAATTVNIKGTAADGTVLFNLPVAIAAGTAHGAAATIIETLLDTDPNFIAAGLDAKTTLAPSGAWTWIGFSPKGKYPGGDTDVTETPDVKGFWVAPD